MPVRETGIDRASTKDKVMHACGEDVHLAAVVAVARALHEVTPPVPLVVVLQPREETIPPAPRRSPRRSVLAAEECRAMIGAHVQPALCASVVACVLRRTCSFVTKSVVPSSTQRSQCH